MKLTQGIVCILGPHNQPHGTGFVVSTTSGILIITCAHVIDWLQPENDTIIFQNANDRYQAKAIKKWYSLEDDVAILQLIGKLSRQVQPLLLGSATGTRGHEIYTFGFPEAGELDGVFGTGTVVELGAKTQTGQQLLQIRSSEITKGFSGAPIWDGINQRVIGMVVMLTQPDSKGRLGETAFAIPTETLRTICPLLQTSDVRPYRNLDAFTESDAAFFFGRERVINTLTDSLQQEPTFLAVLGPSGSGKSSVVQAGLIPQLRQGVIPGSDHWEIIVTRPTDHNFENFVADMQHVQQHTVLVIDQFEELFVAFSSTLQQDILTQLIELLEHVPDISIILTLRDDFYSRFVQQERLAQWLQCGLVNIPPSLTREELKAIVRKPAELLGLNFELGLVEAIIKDAMEAVHAPEEHNGVGASTILPLLEFALTQLWERQEDGVLTHAIYEKIGGVAGSLTQWASRTMKTLDEQKRSLARRIFTDLVYLADENQGFPNSRRRRPLDTLYQSNDKREDVEYVVQQLVNARLLVTSHNLQTMTEEIEIIHDALLREWKELKSWLEEDRLFLKWRQEAERRADAWRKTCIDNPEQRDTDSLLRGRDLVAAVDWLADRRADLNQYIRDFIEASQVHQQQEEHKWKELYLESERRRQIILARDLINQAAWIFDQQTHKLQLSLLLAIESEQRCPSYRADRFLRKGLSLLPRLLTCLAYDKNVSSIALSPDGSLLAIAIRDHPVEIYTVPDGRCITQLKHSCLVWKVAFNSDGSTLATASDDGTVKCWNMKDGSEIKRFVHNSGVTTAIFSPDSRYLVTSSLGETIRVWEVATNRVLFQRTYSLAVSALAVSPDGRYLAIASYGNTLGSKTESATLSKTGSATLLELSTLRCIDFPSSYLIFYNYEYRITSFVFSPDSRYLAVIDNGNVYILDILNENERTSIEHRNEVTSIAFHPDGKILVIGDCDGYIDMLSVRNQFLFYRSHLEYKGIKHEGAINAIAFSPDGMFIATASDDGTVNLWNTATNKRSLSFTHEDAVKNIFISPGGQHLITTSYDHKVRIWETRSVSTSLRLTHHGPVEAISFNPNNSLIATASDDQTAKLWDAINGTEIFCLHHSERVRSIAFHPSDNTMLTASDDGTVKRWDVRNGSELSCLNFQDQMWKVIFSPDGRYFATSGRDQTARIWDASTNRLVAGLFTKGVVNDITFSADSRYLAAALGTNLSVWNIIEKRHAFFLQSPPFFGNFGLIAFSPNGDYFATINERIIKIWNMHTGQEQNTLTHDKYVLAITFSPDSEYIATASLDHTARLWHTRTGKQVISLAHKETVWDVAFSPDGKYIATASRDRTACIWEVTSGNQIACFTHKDRVVAVKFSPDGKYVATASDDNTAQIWLWQPTDMIGEISSRLNRNLTLEEWKQYFGDEPYHKTCPDLS